MKQVALLTTMANERKGMLARPRALNKLAPFFYVPRWQDPIELDEGQLNGSLLMIPMGISNWDNLNTPVKEKLEEKISALCCSQGLSAIGVSRKLGDIQVYDSLVSPDVGATNSRPPGLAKAGDHWSPLHWGQSFCWSRVDKYPLNLYF